MNLFLLASVPLASLVLHRFLFPSRPAFAEPLSWIRGAVWSIVALVVATFFGKLREFSGDLGWAFLGLTLTDVLLVPGLVAVAWALTRPSRDPWELGLWLAIGFTLAGIRDFAATSRLYDLTELLLVPLGRILVLGALPLTLSRALSSRGRALWGWWALTLAVLLTGAVVPVLSFAGLGGVAWVLVAGGLAGAVWGHKKKAAPDSGRPSETTN